MHCQFLILFSLITVYVTVVIFERKYPYTLNAMNSKTSLQANFDHSYYCLSSFNYLIRVQLLAQIM